jgi:DNA-binding response OmpR family regulator
MAKKILLTSHDPALLETRKLLLAGNGYQVFTAIDPREVARLCHDHHFDLVVIGHTIGPSEASSIVQTISESCGDIPMLMLVTGPLPLAGSPNHSMHTNAEGAPAEFIARVHKILGE